MGVKKTSTKKRLAKGVKNSLEKAVRNNRAAGESLREKVEKASIPTQSYSMDLRIHSPTPGSYMKIEGINPAPALVSVARVKGIDLIAVTDFHSGKFIDELVDAARGAPVTVIPGVVIRCGIEICDDVVVNCLFPEHYTSDQVGTFLKKIGVPENRFGDKSFHVPVPLEKVLEVLDKLGGIAIPSRMDRIPYRRQALGALIETYGFRAFDLAYPDSTEIFERQWPNIEFQFFTFSSANALAQVGSRVTTVEMTAPGFSGLEQIAAREVA